MKKREVRRKYTPEFKQDAIELAAKIGVSNAAEKLDIPLNNLLGWEVSHSLSSEVVLKAFYRALRVRRVREGLIVHSDRGVQYTAREFQKKLEDLGFVQSFSRRGNCYDNAHCESCFPC